MREVALDAATISSEDTHQGGMDRRELLMAGLGALLAGCSPALQKLFLRSKEGKERTEQIPEEVLLELDRFLARLKTAKALGKKVTESPETADDIDSYEWRHSPAYLERLHTNAITLEDRRYVAARVMNGFLDEYEAVRLKKYFGNAFVSAKKASTFVGMLKKAAASRTLPPDWQAAFDSLPGEALSLQGIATDPRYYSAMVRWAMELNKRTQERIKNPGLQAEAERMARDILLGHDYQGPAKYFSGGGKFYTHKGKADTGYTGILEVNERKVVVIDYSAARVKGSLHTSRDGKWKAYVSSKHQNDEWELWVGSMEEEAVRVENVNRPDWDNLGFGHDNCLYFTQRQRPSNQSTSKKLCRYNTETGKLEVFSQILIPAELAEKFDRVETAVRRDGKLTYLGVDKYKNNEEINAFSIYSIGEADPLAPSNKLAEIKIKRPLYTIHESVLYIVAKNKGLYRTKLEKGRTITVNEEKDLDKEPFEKTSIINAQTEVVGIKGIKDGYFIAKIKCKGRESWMAYHVANPGNFQELPVQEIGWADEHPEGHVYIRNKEDPLSPEAAAYRSEEMPLDEVIKMGQKPPAESFEKNGLFVENTTVLARDGKCIPVTIIGPVEARRKKGIHPVLIKAYGAHNDNEAATANENFDFRNYIFAKAGAIVVYVNARGDFGRFEGDQWHEDGIGKNKQNGFNDVADVTQWLFTQGIATRKNRPQLLGYSAGGDMAMATGLENQPLLRGVIAMNGPFDLLIHRLLDPDSNWIPEYGDPDDPLQQGVVANNSPFARLLKLQAAGQCTVPMTVGANFHDNRVNPLHTLEFVIQILRKDLHYPLDVLFNFFSHGSDTMETWIQKFIGDFMVVAHKLGLKGFKS